MKCITYHKIYIHIFKNYFFQKLMCTKNLFLIICSSCFMLPGDFISIPDVITILDKLIPTASLILNKYFMEILTLFEITFMACDHL